VSPHPKKKREKESAKLQEKHHYETHKQWRPFDPACKDRSTSKLKFYQPTHKQGNNEKSRKPQRPSEVYKVFTKTGEGKKILTRPKTL
jgi:hypothetical protein